MFKNSIKWHDVVKTSITIQHAVVLYYMRIINLCTIIYGQWWCIITKEKCYISKLEDREKRNDNKVVLLTKQVQQQKTLPSMYNKNRRRWEKNFNIKIAYIESILDRIISRTSSCRPLIATDNHCLYIELFFLKMIFQIIKKKKKESKPIQWKPFKCICTWCSEIKQSSQVKFNVIQFSDPSPTQLILVHYEDKQADNNNPYLLLLMAM